MISKAHNSISILTYNVWMRPTFLFYNNQVDRAWKLTDSLKSNNFDIILLQECFDKKCIKIIVEQLKSIYPYIIEPIRVCTPINSGLLVLSKYPLSDVKFQKFDKLVGADRLASKGFVSFTIDVCGLKISSMVLHQQAGDSKKRSRIRENNLSLISDNKTDIMCGDFNTEGNEVNNIKDLFFGYNIKNDVYTWGMKTLDYIISKYNFLNYNVLDWSFSDHYPVSCVIELHK